MSRNDIECPSRKELLKLASEIKSKYVSNSMAIYRTLDPDSRPYPDEYRKAAQSDVEWLPDKFEEFMKPGPGEFTEHLDAMDKIGAMLGTGMEETDFASGKVEASLDNAQNFMGDWEGALGDSFKLKYLAPMKSDIVHNQGRLTLIMHDGFQAMRDIYSEGRKSLKDIGEQGVAAMDQADGIGSSDVTTLLTVLSSAFGIGAAALSAALPVVGPAVSITTAMVSGGIAAANDRKEKDKEIPLAADYPDECLDNIKEAIESLQADILDKELELAQGLLDSCKEVMDIVGDSFNGGVEMKNTLLTPMMPKMVGTVMDDPDNLSEGLANDD